MKKTGKKDLTPKSPTKIKGGKPGQGLNDNVTLVRAAKLRRRGLLH